jgi:hypothetical protein
VTFHRLTASILFLALFATAAPSGGAYPQVPQGPPQIPGTARPDPEDEVTRRWEHDHEKKANEERFQKIKDDTEKLVTLSNELKDYVAKSNEHTMSLSVIKKAEEIEKLARSVKDKMKAN